ncbi:WD40 repeat-like protein [Meredithblackwellia eburnea MCA 4105]
MASTLDSDGLPILLDSQPNNPSSEPDLSDSDDDDNDNDEDEQMLDVQARSQPSNNNNNNNNNGGAGLLVNGSLSAQDGSDSTNPSRLASPSSQNHHPPRSSSPASIAAAAKYRQDVHTRRQPFLALPSSSTSSIRSYQIEPIITIPQATHINALAYPPCMSNLYTGGADGFIRRYSFHATLNGTLGAGGVDTNQPHYNNLMMKPTGVIVQGGTDTAALRPPVLTGYWENDEPGAWMDELNFDDQLAAAGDGDLGEDAVKPRWGPKLPSSHGLSPVYSLAVQQDELWGLSGTGVGTINLWTIRHDEGQIRHVFRSSPIPTLGHKPKAISCLTLGQEEDSFLSGGWDSNIIQWDLNTGSVVRNYDGHAGQISSVSFRPTTASPTELEPSSSNDVEMPDVEESAPGRSRVDEDGSESKDGVSAVPNSTSQPGDGEGTAKPSEPAAVPSSPASSASSGTGVAAALVSGVPTPTAGASAGAGGGSGGGGVEGSDAEGDVDADGEVDADGDIDDGDDGDGLESSAALKLTAATQGMKPTSTSRDAVRSRVPLFGAPSLPALSSDVFLSTSIDGEAVLWDRRIKNGDVGGARRFDSPSHSENWCSSASWSISGQQVFVGRRNASIDVYDLRAGVTGTAVPLRSLTLPTSSGPVSAVATLPSGRHLLTASFDNIRLWDLSLTAVASAGGSPARGKSVPYRVIGGHHGGTISHLGFDPTCRFLVSTSGCRGWEGATTENLVIHDVKALR